MRPIDLAEEVLDHQLVDSDGRRCGKVDDLELALDRDEPQVAAILVGLPALRERGLLGRIAAWLSRDDVRHVPWESVDHVKAAVTLRDDARSLGLGRGDDRLRPWVEKVPGSHR